MPKTIYEGTDKQYWPEEFRNTILAIPGSESLLKDVDDYSRVHYKIYRYRHNVFHLEGVTVAHCCAIECLEDSAGHRHPSRDVDNIVVVLWGEGLSVVYVEKKIKDAVANFKESKEKRKSLDQLV